MASVGNAKTSDMSAEDAVVVDGILHDFYAWCEENHVPVTAHCAASNGAHRPTTASRTRTRWRTVLQRYPRLHLNLGHFGGTSGAGNTDSWPRKIARLMTDGAEHLYADVGNHRLDDVDAARTYIKALASMVGDPATGEVRHRLMFGSDWYMLAALPEHEQFLSRYRDLLQDELRDTALTDQFLGGAALEFLFGRDGETYRNRQRLLARYRAYAPQSAPPAWLGAHPEAEPELAARSGA